MELLERLPKGTYGSKLDFNVTNGTCMSTFIPTIVMIKLN